MKQRGGEGKGEGEGEGGGDDNEDDYHKEFQKLTVRQNWHGKNKMKSKKTSSAQKQRA